MSHQSTINSILGITIAAGLVLTPSVANADLWEKPFIIPVWGNPDAVAVNEVKSTVYVSDASGSGSVVVIDAATHTVTARIPVDGHPTAIAVDKTEQKVYVGSSSSTFDSGWVSVIDAETNSVTTKIATSRPSGIAVDEAMHVAYVTMQGLDAFVRRIDTKTDTWYPSGWIIPGGKAAGVAVNHSTHKTYVANWNLQSNEVGVIDAAGRISGAISVGINPTDIAVDQWTNNVYVTNSDSDSVSVINTRTNTVMATIPVGHTPQGVAVDFSRHKVYVTNWNSSSVSVIDTTTGTVAATIPVGATPKGVAVDPSTGEVYVTSVGTGSVYVFTL